MNLLVAIAYVFLCKLVQHVELARAASGFDFNRIFEFTIHNL